MTHIESLQHSAIRSTRARRTTTAGVLATLMSVLGCTVEMHNIEDAAGADAPGVNSSQAALVDGYRLQGVRHDVLPRRDLDGNGLDEVWGYNIDAEGYMHQQLALEALPSGGMRVVRSLTPGVQYGSWTFRRDDSVRPIGDADGFGGQELLVTSSSEYGLLHNQPGSLSGFARGSRPSSDVRPLGGKFFDNDPITYVTLSSFTGRWWVVKQDRGGFTQVASLDPAVTGTNSLLRPLGVGRFWGRNVAEGWYGGDTYNAYLLKATPAGTIEVRSRAPWSALGSEARGTVCGVRDFLGSGEDSVLTSADYRGLAVLARSGSSIVVAARAARVGGIAGYQLAENSRNGEYQPPLAADLDGDGRAEVIARSSNGDILVLRANPATQRFDLVAVNPHWQWIGGWRLAGDHVIVATGRFERSDRDALVIKSWWGIGMIGWSPERGFYVFASTPFDR